MPAFHRMLSVLVLTAIVCFFVGSASAERNLIAYPTGQTVFRYAPDRYEILGPASSKFNPAYTVAGNAINASTTRTNTIFFMVVSFLDVSFSLFTLY